MSYKNVLPEIQNSPWSKVDFPATLTVGESAVNCEVTIDPDGAVIHLKQGDIVLPRRDWAFGNASDQVVVLTVNGMDYASWLKKLKADKKSQAASPLEVSTQAFHWQLKFNPKKLGPELVEQIQKTVLRSDVENYLSTLNPGEEVHLTRCPSCQAMLDISPYSDNENLFCNGCSKFLNPKLNVEDGSFGICPGCSYYTKLKGKSDTGSTEGKLCHRCNARSTTSTFLVSLGIAIILLLINGFTIIFLNRYFPVLLLFGALSLLASLYKLTGVIMSSMTRTAIGVTPLENATTALMKGKTDQALKQIESMPNATSNPGILLNLSRGLINAKNYGKANQFAELLVNEYPNFQWGYAARLEAMLGAGASQEEVEEVNREFNEVICRNMVRSSKNLEQIAAAK